MLYLQQKKIEKKSKKSKIVVDFLATLWYNSSMKIEKETEIMTTATLIHAAFSDLPTVVAEIYVGDWTGEKALNYVYRATQNIEGSWSKGKSFEFNGQTYENEDYDDNITVLVPLKTGKDGNVYGLRSTSMGDRIILGGKIYEVAAVGFKEVA